MSKYTYQSLDKPESEFRLLRISKDPHTRQPQCSLRKYKLTNCHDHVALSYTWGKPTPTRNVAVDGASMEVGQNLFDFLNAYTTELWGMDDIEFKKPVFFWIDQLCINQEDPIERSDQVRIMHKIYKQAKNVLIWLGCDPTMLEAARRLRDNEYHDGWALAILLAHPYFSRIWIVQEIALSADSPLIVCGGVELDWDRVSFASRHTTQNLPVAAEATIYEQPRFRDRRTLDECIRSHCESDCHDPRDKVYGLLGLTPEKWRVHVDYTKEVLEVYFDAVAALYEELFDLTDPGCLYPRKMTDSASPSAYCDTLVALGKSMGVLERHLGGLELFLLCSQAAYLGTNIRNVQYTYTGRIYTRIRAQLSSEQIGEYMQWTGSILIPPAMHSQIREIFVPEEEVEVSWGSIIATRQNPLMRDIIPEMGLQLVAAIAEGTAEQSGDSVHAVDRWWYKHDGEIYYFDCPEWGEYVTRKREKSHSGDFILRR